ncbi:MAG: NUMOD1 domain-containing DNA-binding protein [Deltaproteobacteria bacterium]|nr:NUMOD1 domain-containing DNA-binding protein [Deltaproteobacteria bacterium]
MIIISGQTYSTIVDAARELEVSAKTIRQYIEKKIITEPPVIQFGNRKVRHFPKNYVAAAKKQLQKYRTGRNSKE